MRKKILFICIGNMIRSQMAEGFARAIGGDFLEVYSAGLSPTGVVSEEAIVVMQEKEIDISSQQSNGLDAVPLAEMDYVVSLTRTPAARICGPGHSGEMLDWPVEDPLGASFDRFRIARDIIEGHVADFVKLLWQKG